MKKVSLSFRVEAELRAQLEQRAKHLGVSESIVIREILSQFFNKENEVLKLRHEIEDQRKDVTELEQALIKLRADLALGVEALLVAGSQPVSPEKASVWVNENLREL